MDAAAVARNLRLLNAFWFLRDFHLWLPIWIVFLTVQRGFSLTEVTTAEGLFLVGVVLLEVPTGAVADRWGRSRSLALGALALGLAIFLFAFISNFAILLASFLLWSVASTLMSGADMALLFDTLKHSGRDGEYERRAGRGTALSWAGAAFATLAGGPIAAATSLRVTIFAGVVTCLVLAVVALCLREVPHAGSDAHAPGARRTSYAASIRLAFADVWHAPDVRAVILLAGTATAATHAVIYLVQPYLLDRDIEIGFWFSALQVPMTIAGVAGSLIAARLAGRLGVAALLAVPIGGAAAYFVLAGVPGLAAYPALLALHLFGTTLAPIASGYVNRRTTSERRATVLSMQGMVLSLLMAALAPGLGFASDEWGLAWAFATGGLVCLATVLAFGRGLLPLLARSPDAEPALAAEATASG